MDIRTALFAELIVLFAYFTPSICADVPTTDGIASESEWDEFRQVVADRHLAEHFVHWRGRNYFFGASRLQIHIVGSGQAMCKVPIPSNISEHLHFDRSVHSSRPTAVAWSCRSPYVVCCGLDCCSTKAKEPAPNAAEERTAFLFVGGLMLVVIAVGILLEWETRRKEKEEKNAVPKSRTTHYQCAPTYVGSLREPPLPLATCIARSHFVSSLNTDFRGEIDTGRAFVRGGARYLRPIGSYRYALTVLGRYHDGDDWLGCVGSDQEWAVAYHGTTCENISCIIPRGFDLQMSQRCTYGKGIYCAPSPVIAREYSTPYEARGRWYTAVLQVRVDPRVKTVVFNDGGDEYWVVPRADAIRPYGICVYEVTRPR